MLCRQDVHSGFSQTWPGMWPSPSLPKRGTLVLAQPKGQAGRPRLPEWSSEIRGWEGQSGALLKPCPVGLCGPGLPWLAVDHPHPASQASPPGPGFQAGCVGDPAPGPLQAINPFPRDLPSLLAPPKALRRGTMGRGLSISQMLTLRPRTAVRHGQSQEEGRGPGPLPSAPCTPGLSGWSCHLGPVASLSEESELPRPLSSPTQDARATGLLFLVMGVCSRRFCHPMNFQEGQGAFEIADLPQAPEHNPTPGTATREPSRSQGTALRAPGQPGPHLLAPEPATRPPPAWLESWPAPVAPACHRLSLNRQ